MSDQTAALLTGRKERRADAWITVEMDHAVCILADRMGGESMRSEAIRRLLAIGIAADPNLARDAITAAQREREGG